MTHGTVAIRSIHAVGPHTIALELETPHGFDAAPGEFVKLTAFVDGEHVVRFYTVSSPDATETFELTVGIEPDGTLGPWLRDATGETLQVEGPYGTAGYGGEDRSLILAGGPGIGAAVGVAERARADGNDATIIYRGAGETHRDRLDRLEANGVPVELVEELEPAVSRHYTGEEHVFVYGFQPFVTDAIAALEAAGGDPGEAKIENYG